MAARAESSLFCSAVSGCPGLLSLASLLLDTLRIDAPFPARCLSSGEDANQVRLLILGVGDQQQVNAIYHSDGLPARFALDFPILPGDLERIVEDQNCRFEADAVLLAVDPVLSFIQVNSTLAFVMTNLYIR
jgi:hypothetical protein